MFNRLTARAAAALATLLTVVLAGARTRATSQARAVTFIEYALLAVVAVAVGLLFKTQLGGAFGSILAKIKAGLA